MTLTKLVSIVFLQPFDVKLFQLQVDIPADYPLEVSSLAQLLNIFILL